MNKLSSGIHSDIAGAEHSRLSDKAFHHYLMRTQKVFHTIRIKRRNGIVNLIGVLHFPYILRWPENPFSIDDIRHLIQRQCILLNRKGRVNRTNPVLSPQHRIRMQLFERGGKAGILTNFNRQIGNLFRHLKGRNIPITHLLFLPSCGSSVRYGKFSVQVQDVSQCCAFLRPSVHAQSSTAGSSPAVVLYNTFPSSISHAVRQPESRFSRESA